MAAPTRLSAVGWMGLPSGDAALRGGMTASGWPAWPPPGIPSVRRRMFPVLDGSSNETRHFATPACRACNCEGEPRCCCTGAPRRITRVVEILQDEALTELLPMLDRLFTLERADRSEEI